MTPLFAMTLSLPTGMELSILYLFLLLGGLNLALLITGKEQAALLPALIHIGGGVLALYAGSLITLLISWELLTFSAFVLIRQGGTRQAHRAARRYVAVQMVSAVLFFVAAVIHYQITGSLQTTPLTERAQPFVTAAVFIKTAGMPLHFWLVESYPAARRTVTPLLSVFTTKVGVLTAARLVRFELFGFPALAYAGAAVAAVAVIFALRQHQARRLLSYHVVSQVGYMMAGIGLAVDIGTPAITAGLFHLLTHTLYKSLLFMVAAAAAAAFGHEDLTRMGGLGRQRPGLMALCLIGATAIAGVPFTSGYASKETLKLATGSGLIGTLLQAAFVGTGLSFIKFTWLIFLGPKHRCVASPKADAAGPRLAMMPPAIIASLTVLIGLAPQVVPGITVGRLFSLSSITAALAPLSLSLVLWAGLKKRLTHASEIDGRRREYRQPTPLTNRVIRYSRPFRSAGRAFHRQGPQFQLAVILAVLIGIAWRVLP